MSKAPIVRRSSESGAALVVGLVLLLVLTLYGVTAMRSAMLEERMTNNTQDLQIAFQYAEAALREGELLLQQPTLPAFDGTNGLYTYQPPTTNAYVPLWQDDTTTWRAATLTGDATLNLARADYIVEEMLVTTGVGEVGDSLQADVAPETAPIVVYRITARAWGATGTGNPNPMVVLQSTFRRGGS